MKTQIGSLGSIFEEDRVWRPVGDVEKWKQALYEVVSISGYYSRDWLVIFIVLIILALHCICVVIFS